MDLTSGIAHVRCLARQALWQDEVRRWWRDHWPEMARDKAKLSAAIEVLKRIDAVFDHEPWRGKITAAKEILDYFVERCDVFEPDAAGRTLRSMFVGGRFPRPGAIHGSRFPGGNDQPFNLAQNHRLEMLVWGATELWFRLTGDDMASLKIGHPHHPGPFLRFLIAIDGGEATGANSQQVPKIDRGTALHLKARQMKARAKAARGSNQDLRTR